MSRVAVRLPTGSQRLLELLTLFLAPSPSSHSQPYDDPSCSVPSHPTRVAPTGLRAFYIFAVTQQQSIWASCVLAILDTLLQALGKDTVTIDYRANVMAKSPYMRRGFCTLVLFIYFLVIIRLICITFDFFLILSHCLQHCM